MMKAVRKCSFGSFCSLQHCSWKAGGWEIHADFSQCYSMKTGYYSLLSYLGSLPRTKGECLCSWQGTNDLPADAGSVLWMFWSPRCKAWIKYSFCLFYRKTHVFLSHFDLYFCDFWHTVSFRFLRSFFLLSLPMCTRNFLLQKIALKSLQRQFFSNPVTVHTFQWQGDTESRENFLSVSANSWEALSSWKSVIWYLSGLSGWGLALSGM